MGLVYIRLVAWGSFQGQEQRRRFAHMVGFENRLHEKPQQQPHHYLPAALWPGSSSGSLLFTSFAFFLFVFRAFLPADSMSACLLTCLMPLGKALSYRPVIVSRWLDAVVCP